MAPISDTPEVHLACSDEGNANDDFCRYIGGKVL